MESSFAEVERRAREGGNVVPVTITATADTLTPVSAFLRLAEGAELPFLLESVENGSRPSRYSFLGANPREILRIRAGKAILTRAGGSVELEGPPFEAITAHLARYRSTPHAGLPPFLGGATGFIGYDCIPYLEPAVAKLPEGAPSIEDEACLGVYGSVVAFDHTRQVIVFTSNIFTEEESLRKGYKRALAEARALFARIQSGAAGIEPSVALAEVEPGASIPRVRAALGEERFVRAIARIKRHIRDGDIFQCVPSERFEFPMRTSAFSVFRALRRVNPSPYMFYLGLPKGEDGSERAILGASPERLVSVTEDVVEMHPIAGTRPRGKTPDEDVKLERDLLRSVKEKAEHLMLVDLGRNDVGRVSRPGSVRVVDFMRVERFSHVMHIVSTVEGKLDRKKTAWDAIRACFPAGTLTGAPKIRAMQIIADLEPNRRGPYGGAVVRYSFSGDLDSCITIRSLFVNGGVGYSQAGAGVVADSRAKAEYQEILGKSRAMQRAVLLAQRMEPGASARPSRKAAR
jgi:anthranilate synthase component 1